MEHLITKSGYQNGASVQDSGPINNACSRLSSMHNESIELANLLEIKLALVLRHSDSAKEAIVGGPATSPPESPLHKDLLNKVSDVELLNRRLNDILHRVTL